LSTFTVRRALPVRIRDEKTKLALRIYTLYRIYYVYFIYEDKSRRRRQSVLTMDKFTDPIVFGEWCTLFHRIAALWCKMYIARDSLVSREREKRWRKGEEEDDLKSTLHTREREREREKTWPWCESKRGTHALHLSLFRGCCWMSMPETIPRSEINQGPPRRAEVLLDLCMWKRHIKSAHRFKNVKQRKLEQPLSLFLRIFNFGNEIARCFSLERSRRVFFRFKNRYQPTFARRRLTRVTLLFSERKEYKKKE